MKIPSRQFLITVSVCIFLGIAMIFFLCFESKNEKKKTGKQENVPSERQTAIAEYEESIKPHPTVQIPAGLKYPVTAQVLNVLNTYLSQTEETSIGDIRRKSGSALIELKKTVGAMIKTEVENSDDKTCTQAMMKITDEINAAMNEAELIFKDVPGWEKAGFYSPIIADGIVYKIDEFRPYLFKVWVNMKVGCGRDMAFYLFKLVNGKFRLILEKSNTDPEIPGYEGMACLVSKGDNLDDFFIVIKYGIPHCTSCWGGRTIEVLRPGEVPDKPKILGTYYEFLYRCAAVTVETGKDDFIVTFTGSQSLDGPGRFRKCIKHFRIVNEKMTVIDPLGFYPEDFIDEWVKLSWADARRFCDKRDLKELKVWHKKLNEGDFSSSFIFVQPCPGPGEAWELCLEFENAKPAAMLYFDIRKVDGNFRLFDIMETRKGNCPGEASPEPHDVDMG